MIGIYLSGTGNSKHCVEKFVQLLDENSKAFPIENPKVIEEIKKETDIVVGYPTQFSNAPLMVRDFIKSNATLWKGKRIFCINTMGAFSGDGTGCTARLFKKYGATVIGGLQIKMPDSVCDSKLLKKTAEANKNIIRQADEKIESWAVKIKNGKYPKEGLHFYDRLAGLFGQRLWFYGKTLKYTDKLKISDACIGCGLCVSECPMDNLVQQPTGKPKPQGNCTMCYRCISHCPAQAITLLGKQVVEQTTFDKF
ncbi:MAG: EFR1 family ferrodoxin [Butyrivibrio sp.]|nr:EFR1 family ferrodoxin [Butyrivibrio sp.]